MYPNIVGVVRVARPSKGHPFICVLPFADLHSIDFRFKHLFCGLFVDVLVRSCCDIQMAEASTSSSDHDLGNTFFI